MPGITFCRTRTQLLLHESLCLLWSTSTSLDVEVDQMNLNIQGICVSFSLKFPASPNDFSHSEQVWVFSPLQVNMCVFRFLAQPNDFWHWTQCVSFLCCGLQCASSVALLDQMTFCSVNKSASFLHCGWAYVSPIHFENSLIWYIVYNEVYLPCWVKRCETFPAFVQSVRYDNVVFLFFASRCSCLQQQQQLWDNSGTTKLLLTECTSALYVYRCRQCPYLSSLVIKIPAVIAMFWQHLGISFCPLIMTVFTFN